MIVHGDSFEIITVQELQVQVPAEEVWTPDEDKAAEGLLKGKETDVVVSLTKLETAQGLVAKCE